MRGAGPAGPRRGQDSALRRARHRVFEEIRGQDPKIPDRRGGVGSRPALLELGRADPTTAEASWSIRATCSRSASQARSRAASVASDTDPRLRRPTPIGRDRRDSPPAIHTAPTCSATHRATRPPCRGVSTPAPIRFFLEFGRMKAPFSRIVAAHRRRSAATFPTELGGQRRRLPRPQPEAERRSSRGNHRGGPHHGGLPAHARALTLE